MPITLKSCAKKQPFEPIRCISFPGGVEICSDSVPNPLEGMNRLFGKLNTALAPLVPIFLIIEVAISLKNCITAIPDCITSVPPSPKPILDCTKQLIKTLEQLLKMIPQLSIPVLIVGIIDAIISFILAYRNSVATLIAKEEAIIEAEATAAKLSNTQMAILLKCAHDNLGVEFSNLNASMGPVNHLLAIVNGLLDIVGLPCIPSLIIPNKLTQEALTPLDATIRILQELRALIPLPDFGAANSFGKICE